MKLVFLADTHNYEITALAKEVMELPDGDILIHCGDATGMGTLPEMTKFFQWFGATPYQYKILVAGNHDWMFETQRHLAQCLCEEYGILYLEDRGIEIEGLRFYGTPWTPVFFDWAFNAEEEDLAERFRHIPGGLDVLITHGPPFGILDEVTHDFKLANMGCKELREVVDRIKPRVHVFGHNHGGYGQIQIGDTLFINAATCNRRYLPVNPPIVIDIHPLG